MDRRFENVLLVWVLLHISPDFHKNTRTRMTPIDLPSFVGLATPHDTEEFIREAIVMRMFSHPNVLSLLGVSVYEDIPCVILPLMSNGDLKTYMLKHHSVSTH